MSNPLKENSELNDLEIIKLLEITSNDLKRRNNISGSPSGENIQDYLNEFLFGNSKV